MPSTPTRTDLENLTASVNHALAKRESRARVTFGHRYDYYALDLTTTDLEREHPGATREVLRTGTKTELATYLQAMLWGLWLPVDYPSEASEPVATA